ncbi:unnamed protein product [Rotaria socialis]|uniref:Uncharacterized protein n=1 Tax=Rotaria socialis TaxID=392032 RepID=A0A820I9M7_9BILA|nr:unnamed protein product [Rotaria socialis]CAF4640578.1 unnamed protein product [Rotaria socialis]CAF4874253.1 unnamed protein product [Rotaria socialis]
MYLLILSLLINSVQTQQDICSCSCCIGVSCSPVIVGSFSVSSCAVDTCLQLCRTSYYQCQAYIPNGQAMGQCSSSVSPLYQCRCDCCNTGSTSCVPSFVGYGSAYQCNTAACSISCASQYPSQCVSNQNGQVSGTCTGPITTTTTTTTVRTNIIGTGYTCSCMCCSSGSNCVANVGVGFTIASQCSSLSCTQACQNQYPTYCPSIPSLGQSNGICTNQVNGNIRCQCRCCTANGCPTYEINTTGDCTSCSTLCQQQSPCGSTNPAAYTCSTNTNKSKQSCLFHLGLVAFADEAANAIETACESVANKTQSAGIILEVVSNVVSANRELPSDSLTSKYLEEPTNIMLLSMPGDGCKTFFTLLKSIIQRDLTTGGKTAESATTAANALIEIALKPFAPIVEKK